KSGAAQRSITYALQPMKQILGTAQQFLADLRACVAAIHHRLEIALQMRPADLPVTQWLAVVGTPTIGGQHLSVIGAQQFSERRASPRTSDVKDGCQRGHGHPQPGPTLFLPPAG